MPRDRRGGAITAHPRRRPARLPRARARIASSSGRGVNCRCVAGPSILTFALNRRRPALARLATWRSLDGAASASGLLSRKALAAMADARPIFRGGRRPASSWRGRHHRRRLVNTNLLPDGHRRPVPRASTGDQFNGTYCLSDGEIARRSRLPTAPSARPSCGKTA